jgi:hypothetical protein
MYLSHYKLNQKPFEITTDPKFIWLTGIWNTREQRFSAAYWRCRYRKNITD